MGQQGVRSFDNIDHGHLLETIGEVPGRELIRQWLKAGCVEHYRWNPTDTGTPQGGVITPPTIWQTGFSSSP
jgi:RNA-directed DNA polymerase